MHFTAVHVLLTWQMKATFFTAFFMLQGSVAHVVNRLTVTENSYWKTLFYIPQTLCVSVMIL